MSKIHLADDGTMDTVIRCSECGEEFRFNYDPSFEDEPETEDEAQDRYDAFVDECIEEIEAEHECSADEDEPSEDDITTGDHERFYQYGRLAFRVVDNGADRYSGFDSAGACFAQFLASVEAVIRAYNDREQFWPNAWFISDHGNPHLIDLTK